MSRNLFTTETERVMIIAKNLNEEAIIAQLVGKFNGHDLITRWFWS